MVWSWSSGSVGKIGADIALESWLFGYHPVLDRSSLLFIEKVTEVFFLLICFFFYMARNIRNALHVSKATTIGGSKEVPLQFHVNKTVSYEFSTPNS